MDLLFQFNLKCTFVPAENTWFYVIFYATKEDVIRRIEMLIWKGALYEKLRDSTQKPRCTQPYEIYMPLIID